jgi:copper chaperone CopZ
MRRSVALLCAPLLAAGLAACGSTVSTSSFKGAEHEVAQTISNLQADATAGEEKKICANDLAKAVVARLGGTTGCEATIKDQLDQVDSMELNVQSVKVAPAGAAASAQVKGIYAGKTRLGTLSLVKEGGKWKVSSLG